MGVGTGWLKNKGGRELLLGTSVYLWNLINCEFIIIYPKIKNKEKKQNRGKEAAELGWTVQAGEPGKSGVPEGDPEKVWEGGHSGQGRGVRSQTVLGVKAQACC